MEILHFATAGSVDDGKSTLIGRLLYESKAIYQDQLAQVETLSKERGFDYTNLALLTDGLKIEQEQGITVDVAYRYFSTKKRHFIIHDCPGHIEHTRNMVTGCSGASLVLLVVDARNSITEQTKRHATIASLLGVSHVLLCVNKMDLVGYDQAVFESVKEEFLGFVRKLEFKQVDAIPLSALKGDNISGLSPNMGWYEGPSLIHYLEEVYVRGDENLIDLRLPIALSIRPVADNNYRDFRGYAGRLESGILRKGDKVMILPSKFETRISAIYKGGREIEEAYPRESVVVTIEDDYDIGRGDLLCRLNNQPFIEQEITGMLTWMGEEPLRENTRLLFKQLTKTGQAIVKKIHYVLDVNSLHRESPGGSLYLNQIARLDLLLSTPIFFDEYRVNRSSGSLILIDRNTYQTVGAYIIRRKVGD